MAACPIKTNHTMKTNNSIIKCSLSGGFCTVLLCATIAIAPFAAQARGGGGFGGHGGGFGGHGGGFGGHGGGFGKEHNGGGVQHAPAVTQEPASGVPTNAVHHAQLQQHFDQLTRHSLHGNVTTREGRLKRDRIYRTRDYLFGLDDVGWPVDLIDTWYDGLAQDDIVVGMPSELVLDYWGNPVTTESVVVAGAPAQVWTYRLHSNRTTKVTIVGDKVTAVRRA
jgi:hypothetical protein